MSFSGVTRKSIAHNITDCRVKHGNDINFLDIPFFIDYATNEIAASSAAITVIIGRIQFVKLSLRFVDFSLNHLKNFYQITECTAVWI